MILASNKQFVIAENAECLFSTSFISIDLSNIDTSNIENLDSAFKDSIAKEIKLKGIDTSNVRRMAETFKNSNVRELDLSHLDLSNVYRINGLFETSNIKKLKFCNNSTSNLKRCHSTFSGCIMTELDISIDIAEDASMEGMFAWSQIDRLNLNFKNPLNIGRIYEMFGFAVIKNLKLNNFRLSDKFDDKDLQSMFHRSEIENLETDNDRIRQAYINRRKY